MSQTKLPVFFLFMFIFVRVAVADTIGGLLTQDTLKVANSPYTVASNLILPSGSTVVVEPGVELRFGLGLNFTVDGVLKAVGTQTDSIRFTSDNATPQVSDWDGLVFNSASAETLQYCVVEFASEAATVKNTASVIKNSTFHDNNNAMDFKSTSTAVVRSNVFSRNSNTAIRCSDANPTIANNQFSDNISVSSAILCQNSSPVISQNVFWNNGSAGVECTQGSSPSIWQNTIYLNDLGVAVNDSSGPEIKNNLIIKNRQFGVAVNAAEASETIAYNNIWGSGVDDVIGTEPGVGERTTTNSNGDSSDVNKNISFNPAFVDSAARNFHLLLSAPAIDAGDPANPAGVTFWGTAPDMGAFEYDGALPVELFSFRIAGHTLSWMTASETNNFGFEVQRRKQDEPRFTKIAFVPGAGTTLVPQHYTYEDKEELSGVVFYRLKQIDFDGAFVFSQVLETTYGGPVSIVLHPNYPNPFNPTTTITFDIPDNLDGGDAATELAIFNAGGQRVRTLIHGRKSPGKYKINWNGVDNLGNPVSSGMYIYRLRIGKQVFSRRMLLLK